MRFAALLFTSWTALSLALGAGATPDDSIQRRQDGATATLPSLGSQNSQSASATITSGSANSNTQSSQPASNTNTAAGTITGSIAITVTASNHTSSTSTSASTTSNIPSSTPSTAANTTSSAITSNAPVLPLQPRITPALSIGGVVLILTGVVQALIGVKNRWVHIFLSTAYLTSLSIAVLIIYVMNPPVSNAIQGAYFVGIFMTGIIFGAGALIFKEVTEGLGCMLGGFCLSMWFMTLKPGGLITSTGGKAIFISAFCVLAWSLSFSHYTRAYGLIGSTAFAGATAFVLGIDCFSRGGLKEFWLYVWDLNDNVFPLNTRTYPITRGTRVESIVILLACAIGVISQIKLWKVVKDRQKEKTAAQVEDERRREAVEAALGRHLERQNDRDRTEWEKQYGNRLTAKRETILWSEAHGEKPATRVKEVELDGSHSSSESLEMANMNRKSRSMYAARIKRQSQPVTSIPEVDENDPSSKAHVRQTVLDQLEGKHSRARAPADTDSDPAMTPISSPRPENDTGFESDRHVDDDISVGPSLEHDSNHNKHAQPNAETGLRTESGVQQYLSPPEEKKQKKRRSVVSFLTRSPKLDDIHAGSQSQEALVVPEPIAHHSRASSLAATLDFENERLEFPAFDFDLAGTDNLDIVVSTLDTSQAAGNSQLNSAGLRALTPEPELAEEESEADPEEFVRPVSVPPQQRVQRHISHGQGSTSRRQSGSEAGTEILFETNTKRSRANTNETSRSDFLTKGALETMPSQLSHIALSYRTNEWAKHIAAADAPLFEEPALIEEGHEQELPTHLADPMPSTTVSSKRSSLNRFVPPEVTLPLPSTIPSATDGMRINPAIRPEQQIFSAVVPPQPQPVRVRSTSEATKIPSGFRSTSTPMLVRQAIPTPPIEQGAAFAQRPLNRRSASSQSLGKHADQGALAAMRRSASRESLGSTNGVIPPLPQRAASQISAYQPSNYQVGPYQHSPYLGNSPQPVPSRSDTRLQFYDSHQPIRRNTSSENVRREVIMTDWRVSQQIQPQRQSKDQAEMHRQQMLMERQQKRMMEEQEKAYRMQQELATDRMMRTKDMQELHREAMRKMQAGVNKNLNH